MPFRGDRDDDGPARVSGCDTIDRARRLLQRIGPVDHRGDRPGLDEVLQGDEVVVVLRLDGRTGLPLHEQRDEHRPDGAAELAVGVPATVRDQGPARGQRPPRPRHRQVAHVVEDQVIARATGGEVLPRVVDDVVGPDRADQLHVLRAGHAGDLGAEGFRDLHGERADPARRAVDQDGLAGLDLARVAEQLEGRRRGHPDRGRLLEGQVGGLLDEVAFGRAGELGERAGAPAEHLVAGAEGRHVGPDRFHGARDVRPRDRVPGRSQTRGEAHDERRAGHDDPVAEVDGCRVDPDEHLIGADLGHVDVPCLQDACRTVPVLDDRLHLVPRFPASTWRVRRTRRVYGVRYCVRCTHVKVRRNQQHSRVAGC